jgi:tartrate dehydrogenase/decarboxylase / D-malate dehydrogenase
MAPRYRIAVIAGDGIGPEVVPVAVAAVDAVSTQHGFAIDWTEYPWGWDYYRHHGKMMPSGGLGQLASSDAILLGAVGDPAIPTTLPSGAC